MRMHRFKSSAHSVSGHATSFIPLVPISPDDDSFSAALEEGLAGNCDARLSSAFLGDITDVDSVRLFMRTRRKDLEIKTLFFDHKDLNRIIFDVEQIYDVIGCLEMMRVTDEAGTVTSIPGVGVNRSVLQQFSGYSKVVRWYVGTGGVRDLVLEYVLLRNGSGRARFLDPVLTAEFEEQHGEIDAFRRRSVATTAFERLHDSTLSPLPLGINNLNMPMQARTPQAQQASVQRAARTDQ